MNRKLLALLAILVLFFITLLVYKINNAIKIKARIEHNIVDLPNFSFYNLQQQPFTKDSLPINKPSLFIYFNTDCEHCQYEATEIVKNTTALRDDNIVFVSNQPYTNIRQFDNAYHLSQYSFIRLLKDSTDNFYKTFGTSTVPSLVLYNSKGALIKNYKGEVDITTVITLLNKNN